MIDDTATCFRSPNFPSNYGNNENCSITVRDAVALSVEAFDTESGYDFLMVDGVQYDGTSGPENADVAAGTIITFTSDGSVTRTGFEICGAFRATDERKEASVGAALLSSTPHLRGLGRAAG